MLERMQLFPLNFYKKAKFNGSMGKMNYRLAKEEKKTDEENSETILVGSIWEGPFIYDKIPQEKITKREFPFAEEGICQAMDWFNEEGKNEPGSVKKGSIFLSEGLFI